MDKKYVSLNTLQTFLNNLKNTFSLKTHKHTILDIEDYVIDTELNSESTNPVQNKVLNAEFEAISQAMTVYESELDGKASSNHTHSGYATTSHKHSATDITSGTLPVARGGTGVTSLNSLASNLSSYMSNNVQIAVGSYTGSGSNTNTISIGFTPKAVIISNYGYGGISNSPLFFWNDKMTTITTSTFSMGITSSHTIKFSTSSSGLTITSSSFDVYNTSSNKYWWLAIG